MHVPSLSRLMLAAGTLLTMLLLANAQAQNSAHPLLQSDVALESSQFHLPLIMGKSETRFAVIGDFGTTEQSTQDVAALIKSWQPDYILTTGDNNYPAGEAATIDQHIGAHYHDYIAPYYGQYGAGSTRNRFFPSLGNHDWASGGQAHFDYFTLPGNERYYDIVLGPVHVFAVDSDPHEPDGVTADSIQGQWLQQALANSSACWKIVYMHHPPFSSGAHGPSPWMQWPYHEWGADAVLAGHDHTYERIQRDDILYFVTGLGGRSIYPFPTAIEGSQVRFNGDVGAMFIEAHQTQAVFSFITRTGFVVDTHQVDKTCSS